MPGPATSNSLTKRIAELERLVHRLERRLADRPAQVAHHRDVRLAVTVDDSYPDGSSNTPAYHCIVPISFIDATFEVDAADGWGLVTTQERKNPADDSQAVAANVVPGQFIPIGTIVWALWQRPVAGVASQVDGEWWIMSTAGTGPGRIIKLDANLATGSTGTASVYNRVSGTISDSGTNETVLNITGKELIAGKYHWVQDVLFWDVPVIITPMELKSCP